MQKWGEALHTGDIEHITAVFSGNEVKRKITKDIDKYIRKLYREIYLEHGCHSNIHIRDKVEEIFEVPVGYESVRHILNDEKLKFIGKSDQKETFYFPVLYSKELEISLKIKNYFDKMYNDTDSGNSGKMEDPGKNTDFAGGNRGKKSKYLPILYPSVKPVPKNNLFLHHAGLLTARIFIDESTIHLNTVHQNIARQWISMILCGCLNIEQGQKL
jgi:hypothetical protein